MEPAALRRPFGALVALKAAPLILFGALCALPRAAHRSGLVAVIAIAAQIAEFAAVKNAVGGAVVGVAWEVDPASDAFFRYTAQPPQFIPDQREANAFWASFAAVGAVWAVAAVAAAARGAAADACAAAVGAIAQAINWAMFRNAHFADRERNGGVAMMGDEREEFAPVREEEQPQ